ncbi:MAG: HAD family phosphatase [Planctomycetota bacterium]|nr:MAG: HAD family phosphatase [Planctomycetota bacterium]
MSLDADRSPEAAAVSRFPPRPIRAVAFDLDGLIFNTEDVFEIVCHRLVEERGERLTPEVRKQMMGRRAQEAYQVLRDVYGWDEPLESVVRRAKELFFEHLDGVLRPMPGLFTLLERLERLRLPKAVATSSNREHLCALLDRFDLLRRFDATLAAEDVHEGKPHPEVYLKAAERLGVAPRNLLVLEDSEAGTNAGANAGAVTVAVPHRHSAGHDFHRADYIARSLDDPVLLAGLEAVGLPEA